jgi:hypothetical protein
VEDDKVVHDMGKPLWRRGVDAVDKLAAPVLEGATRHQAFRTGVGAIQQTQRAITRRTERLSRHFLHRLNLPTATDVNRLLTQIAAVENRVRVLSTLLEEPPPRGTSTAPLDDEGDG